MTWSLNPAVRDPKGQCIEEENCDWELATVCAFDQAQGSDDKVNFLVCMDESESRDAMEAAKSCSTKANVDYDKLQTCFSGDQGAQLLAAASDVWNKQFPDRATVPHTFVNGKDTDAAYQPLEEALCQDGSTAPACKSLSQGNATRCVV